MQTLSASEAAAETLSALLERAKDTPVVISSGDMSLGAIVSMEDLEIVRKAKAERFLASLEPLGTQLREEADKQGLSPEDMERMLDRHNQ